MKILSLILIHQKEKLCENHGDNPVTKRLIEIYFYLLQSNQSETIKLNTFASLRLLINKAPTIFLDGNSILCSNLCLKVCLNKYLKLENFSNNSNSFSKSYSNVLTANSRVSESKVVLFSIY